MFIFSFYSILPSTFRLYFCYFYFSLFLEPLPKRASEQEERSKRCVPVCICVSKPESKLHYMCAEVLACLCVSIQDFGNAKTQLRRYTIHQRPESGLDYVIKQEVVYQLAS